VPENSVFELQAALLFGPVAVAIDASSTEFYAYSSGVLTPSECGYDLDHAVTVVGYNNKVDPPYYIVKNSWG
jgi:C1A family cysteine protease